MARLVGGLNLLPSGLAGEEKESAKCAALSIYEALEDFWIARDIYVVSSNCNHLIGNLAKVVPDKNAEELPEVSRGPMPRQDVMEQGGRVAVQQEMDLHCIHQGVCGDCEHRPGDAPRNESDPAE